MTFRGLALKTKMRLPLAPRSNFWVAKLWPQLGLKATLLASALVTHYGFSPGFDRPASRSKFQPGDLVEDWLLASGWRRSKILLQNMDPTFGPILWHRESSPNVWLQVNDEAKTVVSMLRPTRTTASLKEVEGTNLLQGHHCPKNSKVVKRVAIRGPKIEVPWA